MRTFNRQPLVLVRGQGARVWDEEGKSYLDMVAGLAVNVLGHCHPAVVDAITRQAGQLIHTTNLYYTTPQLELAELLIENSCADRIFFANSGAEA
ncbi:MAG: aminotransferase class III-fold pyridoxal phosphate-dependent enzyme, partial [Chloroflexota bacterium]